ncbi:hypothetical protein GAGA_1370 [Paraglaciecola agarilytica NO2]|uniref:Uncharacterized protein n=1 Tax=Paraglaciecola agarilytica NO2 TaxID=1125747 RepID=A0ABQ0I4J0_9ALTE|nr:hypothetical protein GAGA_1370 [Paraglaciecola agarilytica NO2]
MSVDSLVSTLICNINIIYTEAAWQYQLCSDVGFERQSLFIKRGAGV